MLVGATLVIAGGRGRLARHCHDKEGEKAISANKVFVGNLNFNTTRDEIVTFLSQAGEVRDVYLPTDRRTGRPRGFAFVEFSSASEAAQAIEQLNEKELGGRKLNINQADERPPRAPVSSGPPQDGYSGFDGFGGGAKRPFKAKGSRRKIRARKRSL